MMNVQVKCWLWWLLTMRAEECRSVGIPTAASLDAKMPWCDHWIDILLRRVSATPRGVPVGIAVSDDDDDDDWNDDADDDDDDDDDDGASWCWRQKNFWTFLGSVLNFPRSGIEVFWIRYWSCLVSVLNFPRFGIEVFRIRYWSCLDSVLKIPWFCIGISRIRY